MTLFAGFLVPYSACLAVTVTPSEGGGPTPQQLAEKIADAATGVWVTAQSATTVINNGSSTLSSPRSMGTFSSGLTSQGTQLPPDNDGTPPAVYAGGLGVASGVCLCTGAVTDSDVSNPLLPGRGVGVEGPNNGIGEDNAGEISQAVLGLFIIDTDFDRAVFNSTMTTNSDLLDSGDPAVLEFTVLIDLPGFVRISTVFGSDEYDAFIEDVFNDSFAILVKKACDPTTAYENIAVLNVFGVKAPFSLQQFASCGPPNFKENQVAPEPAELPPSAHAIDKNGDGIGNAVDGVPYFDHEFGGFASLRTWETGDVLAPGSYTVKIVIHDVGDARVDAALFVAEHSLKLYDFLRADFDLNGIVDGSDLLVWQQNYDYIIGGKKFTQGDATGDGFVTSADLSVLAAVWGRTDGHANLRADFDRNGIVDGSDFLIWQKNIGLTQCASRFEGDADGDGDVDGDDRNIFEEEQGGGQMAMALDGHATDLAPADDSVDADHDGDVDLDDVGFWLEISKQIESGGN